MKAILVVDIPDDFKFKKSYADITLVDGEHNMWKRITKVKPMPQERDIFEQGYDEEDTRDISQWNKGFNACIDEILGKDE